MTEAVLVIAALTQAVALWRSLGLRRYARAHVWAWSLFVATLSLMLLRRIIAAFELGIITPASWFAEMDAVLTLLIALAAVAAVEGGRVVMERIERTEALVELAEQRFMGLVDSMDDVVFLLDKNGRYVTMRGRWMEQHGYKPEDFAGRRPEEMLPADTADLYDRHNRRALAGETVEYEEWSVTPWGERACFHTVITPCFDAQGGIAGAIGVGRNVTDLRTTAQELTRAKEYAEGIIETAESIIVGLDAACTITVFNRQAEALTGLDRADVLGRNWFDIGVADLAFRSRWASLSRGEGEGTFQCTLERSGSFSGHVMTPGGESHSVMWRVAPIVEEGETVGAVLLGTDITEARHLEREIERLTARDKLTGLASRELFEKMLATQVDHARDGEQAVMIAMKVEGITQGAALHGQAESDQTLQRLARRLAAEFRPADRFARVGGDQFAGLLAGGTIDYAAEFARNLREVVRSEKCGTVLLDVSIGAVPVLPRMSASRVFDAAIAAMYQATRATDKVQCLGPDVLE